MIIWHRELKKVVSAIDLVVKHKGADFLKPKAVMGMSWYQEHGYDILGFVFAVILLFSWLTFKLCSCCLGRCFKKKAKQEWLITEFILNINLYTQPPFDELNTNDFTIMK